MRTFNNLHSPEEQHFCSSERSAPLEVTRPGHMGAAVVLQSECFSPVENVSLLQSTGSEQVDRLLQGIVGVFSLVVPTGHISDQPYQW